MLSIGLVVLALYDVIFTLRVSGDPTLTVIDMTGAAATTINNPGFRDGRGNGKYLKKCFSFFLQNENISYFNTFKFSVLFQVFQ